MGGVGGDTDNKQKEKHMNKHHDNDCNAMIKMIQ